MKTSLRRQLIGLNIAVVAISSLALGGILVAENQRRAYDRVDRELLDRVRPFLDNRADRFPNFGPPNGIGMGRGGPGPDGGPRSGPGDNGPGRMFRGGPPDGPPGIGGGGGQNRPPPGPDDPFFQFRRALLINRDGKVIAPNDASESYDRDGAELAFAGKSVWSTIRFGTDRIRVLTVPWRDPQTGPVVIQVARDLRDVEAFEASMRNTFLWGLPFVLLVAGGGALFLVSRALNPINRVIQEAERISADSLSERLTVVHDDEIGRLATTFNGLMTRLEAAFGAQRAMAERQRQFTADASHELRTPLTRLRLATSAGLTAPDEEKSRDALKVADQAGAQMDRLVQQLLLLSRVDADRLPLHPEHLDLRVVVADALMLVSGADRIEVDMPSDPLMMIADADVIRRVTINLAENALKYAPEPARISLTVGEELIEVSDEGPGLLPNQIEHLGERFYRVDQARGDSGVGLGLSIVKALLAAHGGGLTITSTPGVLTVFSARISDLAGSN